MYKFTLLDRLFILVIFVLCSYKLEISCRKINNKQRSWRNQNYNGSYGWEVGEWNQCLKGKSCNEPGIQRRILSCVDSARKKTASKKCNRKRRPSRKKLCVPLQCQNQTNFKMRFWPWSSCASQPLSSIKIPDVVQTNSTVEEKDANSVNDNKYRSFNDGGSWRSHVVKTCGSFQNTIVFVRKRNVSCFANWPNSNTQVKVEIENCLQTAEQRPKSLELCSFGCKKKCAVTFWNEWKSCENCRKKIRYRIREIAFVQSTNELISTRETCPHLVEMKLQLETNQTRQNKLPQQFQLANWSSCEKFTSSVYLRSKDAVIGFRKRSMVCVDANGKRDNCEKENLVKIPLVESCILPRDCKVSNWGEWSTCEMVLHNSESKIRLGKLSYVKKRFRRIIVLALAGGAACPHLSEFRTCRTMATPLHQRQAEYRTLQNETFEWFLGKFDKCNHDGNNCGSGFTRRDVFCIKRGDRKFKPIGPQFCAHLTKPIEEKFCGTSCRQVCVLGEWGEWSTCMADCKKNSTQPIQGTHYRVRRVIQYSGDPRACSDYAESRPCFLKSCVSWMAGTQTVCLMDNIHRTCGNGKTHRAVYCLNSKGYQVKDALCTGMKPPRSLSCHVPCADDCVLGTWSDWGPCEGDCGMNGTQRSGIQMRKQRILAYPGWSGRPCPSSKELIQKQPCLGTACGTYHWKVGPWSTCLLKSSRYGPRVVMDAVNRRCLIGSKVRTVSCLNTSDRRVRDNLCTASLKPSVEKECHLCPEDCVLSPWTQWSDCPETCTELQHTKVRTRKRRRFIITPGIDGGIACPRRDKLVENKECDACVVYAWKVSDWNNCHIVPGGNCRGFQTRQVYCVKQNGIKVADGWCLDRKEKPEEIRECQENCNEQCNLTSWSRWSRCSKPCGTGFSTRTRNVFGNRIRCAPETAFAEDRPCNTHNCGHYSLRIGKWSTCYATDPLRKCGEGVQWRNISCFKINGLETSLDYCIDELYDGHMALNFQRNCKIECPLNCKLSPWTKFTSCSRKCGAGIRSRFRTVIQQATQGGQICVPATASQKQITEKIPCREKDCYHFTWRAGPWGECQLKNQTRDVLTKCGTGYHTRIIHCHDKQYTGQRSIINDSFCDYAEKPIERKPCLLSCPGECVVGYWSSWSTCSARCPRPGHRRRERSVLRYPAHDKKSCPTLEQYKACNINKCYTYYWRVTQWSSCLFFRANVSCGVGRQSRMADCSRSDGKIVNPFYCRVEGQRVPLLVRMCNLPCPKNCDISQWGTWSRCPEKCNSPSSQVRNRFVLAKAENGGQPCLESEELQEFRACRLKACYRVSVGQWNECLSDIKNSCGMASKRRAVHCVRDDGKLVRDLFCPQIDKGNFPRFKLCKIPCRGDCVMTEWSSWSSCFGICSVENKTVFNFGSRLRSRAVLQQAADLGLECPNDLIQKEKCSNPLCFTFSWRMGRYVGNSREVWCERSDGIKVTRGCSPAMKPSTSKSCQPPCSVRNSFCDSRTICTCKKNYVAILGSTGHLIHCFADSNSNSLGNKSLDIVIGNSDAQDKKNTSWFNRLPIIIWVIIGVCFLYLLLFLAIIIVYTRRRTKIAKQRRANTADVGTVTTPERIPLAEQSVRHERTDSKISFATSSGRGSTLSAISDHEDGEQWPDPPDDIVSEYIRQHLKNFTGGSFCSDYSDEALTDAERERTLNSLKKVKFEVTDTL